jgi:hypothetical protein
MSGIENSFEETRRQRKWSHIAIACLHNVHSMDKSKPEAVSKNQIGRKVGKPERQAPSHINA